MSRHAGVSCDNCLASNFRGKRFKCLICYDYDLCETCHSNEVSTSRHLKTHPMQCILTRNEYSLFFVGEQQQITVDSPPSFTCPLCGALGFSDTALQEHVNLGHQDSTTEVVCPICAAMPSGDQNHVTDDFATHLAIEHHSAPRENTDEQNGRQARRMFYPGRGMRSGRPHRGGAGAINMHFGDAPTNAELLANASSNIASGSSGRDPMDPIAELLSQLSGVRNPHLQSVSTATQLQELHTQLQFERQRASILRQQLKRTSSGSYINRQNRQGRLNEKRNLSRPQRRERASKRENSTTTKNKNILNELPFSNDPPTPQPPPMFGPIAKPIVLSIDGISPCVIDLERVPSKSNTNQTGSSNTQAKSFSDALKGSGSQITQSQSDDDDPRFLLTRLNETNLSESEESKVKNDSLEMGFFVKDMLMSLEDLDSEEDTEKNISSSIKEDKSQVPIQYVSGINTTHPKVGLAISTADISVRENEVSSHASVKLRHIPKDDHESESSEILDADVKRKVQLKRESRDNSHLPVHESNEARNQNTRLRFPSHGQILLTNEYLSKID